MKTNHAIITLGLVAIGAVIVYNKFIKKPTDSSTPEGEMSNAGGKLFQGQFGTYCICQLNDGTVKDGGVVNSQSECNAKCAPYGVGGTLTRRKANAALRKF
jgi:hypothetical protein